MSEDCGVIWEGTLPGYPSVGTKLVRAETATEAARRAAKKIDGDLARKDRPRICDGDRLPVLIRIYNVETSESHEIVVWGTLEPMYYASELERE